MRVFVYILVGLVVISQALKQNITNDSDFSYNTAIFLWNVMRINKCSEGMMFNTTCPLAQRYKDILGESTYIYNKTTETNGAFVMLNNDTLVLSLRGTETLVQTYYDIMGIFKMHIDYLPYFCRVGKGFYETYLSVKDQIYTSIVYYKKHYLIKRFYISGHSLGGAVGALAALDLWINHGIFTTAIYTYGSPRVGNQKFAQFFNEQIPHYYRIVNSGDAVPHFPLAIQGFKHMGVEIWINLNNTIRSICVPTYSKNNMYQYQVAVNNYYTDTTTTNLTGLCSENIIPLGFSDHITYMNRMIFDCVSPM